MEGVQKQLEGQAETQRRQHAQLVELLTQQSAGACSPIGDSSVVSAAAPTHVRVHTPREDVDQSS
eukprot:6629084-Prymnesium_polylepis.1